MEQFPQRPNLDWAEDEFSASHDYVVRSSAFNDAHEAFVRAIESNFLTAPVRNEVIESIHLKSVGHMLLLGFYEFSQVIMQEALDHQQGLRSLATIVQDCDAQQASRFDALLRFKRYLLAVPPIEASSVGDIEARIMSRSDAHFNGRFDLGARDTLARISQYNLHQLIERAETPIGRLVEDI